MKHGFGEFEQISLENLNRNNRLNDLLYITRIAVCVLELYIILSVLPFPNFLSPSESALHNVSNLTMKRNFF